MKVEPIRDEKDIKSIKKLLEGNPRDKFLFVLGINTGCRMGDLVKLRVKDFRSLNIGDTLEIIEEKTGKHNFITVNKSIHKVWKEYYNHYNPNDTDYIFFSRKKGFHLHVNSVKRMIKEWCKSINLSGNFGSHTLRKTFGYHQRTKYGVSLEMLMIRYNHTSLSTTKSYIGLHRDEVIDFCLNEIG